jgi:hypothetical protein
MAYRDSPGLAKVRLGFRPALIDFNVFVAVGQALFQIEQALGCRSRQL